MKFFGLLAPLVVLLSACSASQPHFSRTSAPDTQALLKEQTRLIDAQSQRLDAIAGAHDTLMQQMSTMQTQVAAINHKVSQSSSQAPGNKNRVVSSFSSRPELAINESNSLQGKAILGRVEYAWLPDVNQYLKARIDTGAKSSSLHATNIQRFERNGERWVRFDVALGEDGVAQIEAPLLRHVRIRQASVDELERRPVVKLPIRLGELMEETEFSLTDRNEMLYPILLGRSFLRDIAIVDVAKKFTRPRDPKLSAQVAKSE